MGRRGEPPAVSFHLGAMSPYSWFAAERIDALLPAAAWRPVFAGGLFRAAGRTSWGLTEDRERGMRDCEERADAHGLGPVRWPEPWPTNDLLVARAMVWASGRGALRAFALAAMRLAFREGGELGDPEVVAEAGRRADLDADALTAGLAEAGVKAELRRRTDEAAALGVVGVPTVIAGGRLFWGDDRLEEAAAVVRGGAPG